MLQIQAQMTQIYKHRYRQSHSPLVRKHNKLVGILCFSGQKSSKIHFFQCERGKNNNNSGFCFHMPLTFIEFYIHFLIIVTIIKSNQGKILSSVTDKETKTQRGFMTYQNKESRKSGLQKPSLLLFIGCVFLISDRDNLQDSTSSSG